MECWAAVSMFADAFALIHEKGQAFRVNLFYIEGEFFLTLFHYKQHPQYTGQVLV